MTRKRKVSRGSKNATIVEATARKLKDEAILLCVDLKNHASVLEYFPLHPKGGNSTRVPLHIQGFDYDYTKNFWKIREFRAMSSDEQKLELQWGKSSRMK